MTKVTITQKWSLHGKKVVKSGNLHQNRHYVFSSNRQKGRGGGGGCYSLQTFPIFSGMGRAYLQTKFSAVALSLGLLSIKNFSDRTYCLGSKIRQSEGAGGGNYLYGLFYLFF